MRQSVDCQNLSRLGANGTLTEAAHPLVNVAAGNVWSAVEGRPMSTKMTSSVRRHSDHFEPQDTDPHEQRRLRGQLEQIDYAAYVANKELIGHTLTGLDAASLQKLAVLTAGARAKWGAEALRLAHSGSPVTPDQVARLTAARTAFDELAEVYEALRRMVERGYVVLK
ncbi:hypothetical protein GCM10010203_66390 [Actinomadura yumaensis]